MVKQQFLSKSHEDEGNACSQQRNRDLRRKKFKSYTFHALLMRHSIFMKNVPKHFFRNVFPQMKQKIEKLKKKLELI